MAILDQNTEFIPGTTGAVNNMRIGTAKDGKTVVHFVHYKKITGNHVDQAELVGEVAFSEADLLRFHKLLSDHIGTLKKKLS